MSQTGPQSTIARDRRVDGRSLRPRPRGAGPADRPLEASWSLRDAGKQAVHPCGARGIPGTVHKGTAWGARWPNRPRSGAGEGSGAGRARGRRGRGAAARAGGAGGPAGAPPPTCVAHATGCHPPELALRRNLRCARDGWPSLPQHKSRSGVATATQVSPAGVPAAACRLAAATHVTIRHRARTTNWRGWLGWLRTRSSRPPSRSRPTNPATAPSPRRSLR